MKKISYIILVAFLTITYSCTDELDLAPTVETNIIPSTTTQLEGLLDASITGSDLSYYSDALNGPDAYIHPTIAQKENGVSSNALYYSWEYTNDDFLKFINPDDGMWKKCYRAILNANVVIGYLDEVSGTDAQHDAVKRNAYFQRAFFHFLLVNKYGAAYNKTTADSDLGIIIRNNDALESGNRSTVQQCFDQILSDLDMAETLGQSEYDKTPLGINEAGVVERFKGTYTAAVALKAKVYLVMGDFEEANKYAGLALQNKGVAKLVDFNDVEYSDASAVNVTFRTSQTETKDTVLQAPEIVDGSFRPNMWDEELYTLNRKLTGAPSIIAPSQELLNLYGANDEERSYDLRWKKMFIQANSLALRSNEGEVIEGEWVGPVKHANYVGRYNYGLSLSEMKLIQAEYLAREGQYGEAQNIINEIRAYRFEADAPEEIVNINLEANTAVKQVLDERRREFPFLTVFIDMKRCAALGEANYYPSFEREFFSVENGVYDPTTPVTYNFDLSKDYKKLAFPIPIEEITSAKQFGIEIVQNTY